MDPEPKGSLFLIPNVLDLEAPLDLVMAPGVLAEVKKLRRFVVEGDRAAWRLLSRIMTKEELEAVSLERLDEHSLPEDLPRLLKPALKGQDLGLLSEAGLPCVADPGGALVAAAHAAGLRVSPLVGPSSLLLALMASGLDGQRFSFLGYLPQDHGARRNALISIERGIMLDGGTRIFIETPYRNDKVLADCLEALGPETMLCVAQALSSERQVIRSKTVAAWRAEKPLLGKDPAVFLLGRTARLDLRQPEAQAKPKAPRPAPREGRPKGKLDRGPGARR